MDSKLLMGQFDDWAKNSITKGPLHKLADIHRRTVIGCFTDPTCIYARFHRSPQWLLQMSFVEKKIVL